VGIARQINNLCRISLLLAMMEQKEALDKIDLKRVIYDQDGQVGCPCFFLCLPQSI
jgi:hypothetical protein